MLWLSGLQAVTSKGGESRYLDSSSNYLRYYAAALKSAQLNAPSLLPVLVFFNEAPPQFLQWVQEQVGGGWGSGGGSVQSQWRDGSGGSGAAFGAGWACTSLACCLSAACCPATPISLPAVASLVPAATPQQDGAHCPHPPAGRVSDSAPLDIL